MLLLQRFLYSVPHEKNREHQHSAFYVFHMASPLHPLEVLGEIRDFSPNILKVWYYKLNLCDLFYTYILDVTTVWSPVGAVVHLY